MAALRAPEGQPGGRAMAGGTNHPFFVALLRPGATFIPGHLVGRPSEVVSAQQLPHLPVLAIFGEGWCPPTDPSASQ